MPWTCTSAPLRQHAQTALSITRHWRTSSRPAFTRRVASRRSRISIWETHGEAISDGEPTERCGSSNSSIRRLRQEERAPGPTGTIEAPVEQLDLATVIEVSQALSGEMVLEKLIDRLMRAAIEHAGAERGLLITPQSDELQIEAEATTRGQDVIVQLPDGAADRVRVAGVTHSLCNAHARKCDSRRCLARKIRLRPIPTSFSAAPVPFCACL